MNRFHAVSRLLAAAALLLGAAAAQAQPSFDARLGSGLDALRSDGLTQSQWAFTGSFTPEVLFNAGHGRAWYALDAGNADASGDWTSLHHALGARYRLDLAGDALQAFVGGSAELQRNGDAWQDAGYDALQAFVNLQGRRVGPLTLRGGVRAARRTFDALPAMDQDEAEGFASALLNFESRTTAIAELRFGGKSWAGDPFGYVPSTAAISPGTALGGRGAGRGSASPLTLPATTPVSLAPLPAADARQWTALLRLAQGLGERTGLHVQATLRGLGGDPAPLRLETPAGYFDDGVLDDPYASELRAVQAGLTRTWGESAALRLTGEWRQRDFPAAGTASAPLDARRDRVWRGLARLSLPLFGQRTGAFDLGLAVDYAYTLSHSTDAFYEYRHHLAGLSVTLSR